MKERSMALQHFLIKATRFVWTLGVLTSQAAHGLSQKWGFIPGSTGFAIVAPGIPPFVTVVICLLLLDVHERGPHWLQSLRVALATSAWVATWYALAVFFYMGPQRPSTGSVLIGTLCAYPLDQVFRILIMRSAGYTRAIAAVSPLSERARQIGEKVKVRIRGVRIMPHVQSGGSIVIGGPDLYLYVPSSHLQHFSLSEIDALLTREALSARYRRSSRLLTPLSMFCTGAVATMLRSFESRDLVILAAIVVANWIRLRFVIRKTVFGLDTRAAALLDGDPSPLASAIRKQDEFNGLGENWPLWVELAMSSPSADKRASRILKDAQQPVPPQLEAKAEGRCDQPELLGEALRVPI